MSLPLPENFLEFRGPRHDEDPVAHLMAAYRQLGQLFDGVQRNFEELGVGVATAEALVVEEFTDVSAFSGTWVNHAAATGGTYHLAGYYKDPFGVVRLKGVIAGGVIGTSAFTLPEGYRPGRGQMFVVDSDGAHGRVVVGANGTVTPNVGLSSSVWLDGISFRAA